MAEEGSSFGDAAPVKTSFERFPDESRLCPLPVHDLSNIPVQDLSSAPVHHLSSIDVNTGKTDGEQVLNTSTGQVVNSSTRQVVDSPDDSPEPFYLLRKNMASWTDNQIKVLGMFRQCRHCVTNHKAIGEKFGIPYGTVRNIIRRLTSTGLIRSELYINAAIRGIEVWYCGSAPCPFVPDSSGMAQSPRIEDEQAGCTAPEQHVWTGAEHLTRTGGEHLAYKEDRKKEYGIEIQEKNQSIVTLAKGQINELWPSMGKAGLFASHIREVLSAMVIQGIEETPEKIIAQSLRFIDWQLSQGALKDKHGKDVLDPVAYWRAAMKSNGFYQKPPGYIDPEVLALQQLSEEGEAKVKAMHALAQQRAEMEKAARRTELDAILQSLINEGENHRLWPQVHAAWTENVRLEVKKNPQAILSSPGIAAATRIYLRKLYDWPD
jgi:hypothetical protein